MHQAPYLINLTNPAFLSEFIGQCAQATLNCAHTDEPICPVCLHHAARATAIKLNAGEAHADFFASNVLASYVDPSMRP